MAHIVVDPITRIEGHLRVEIEVEGNKVTDAISSGTAWRGLEVIAKNRDPRDLWAYIQRICGVCTSSHSLGCVRAVEDALGIKIPKNANYIRNIMAATLTVHDHLVHFYHLHALDWVSPLEALKADHLMVQWNMIFLHIQKISQKQHQHISKQLKIKFKL